MNQNTAKTETEEEIAKREAGAKALRELLESVNFRIYRGVDATGDDALSDFPEYVEEEEEEEAR